MRYYHVRLSFSFINQQNRRRRPFFNEFLLNAVANSIRAWSHPQSTHRIALKLKKRLIFVKENESEGECYDAIFSKKARQNNKQANIIILSHIHIFLRDLKLGWIFKLTWLVCFCLRLCDSCAGTGRAGYLHIVNCHQDRNITFISSALCT